MIEKTALILLVVPAGLAILNWLALIEGWRRVDFFAKPGVMLALILWSLVVLNGRFAEPAAVWFLTGLFFSGLGDIFLMLPRERFIAGLGSFLLAHLCFTTALISRGFSGGGVVVLTAGLALLAATYLLGLLRKSLLSRGLSKLWLPVVLYAVVISIMLLAGTQTLFNPGWQKSAAALLTAGALLFYASDALLAWNRFIRPVFRGQLFVRILYHAGQLLMTAGFFYHRLVL